MGPLCPSSAQHQHQDDPGHEASDVGEIGDTAHILRIHRVQGSHSDEQLHDEGSVLTEMLWHGLSRARKVRLYGPPPEARRTPTVSFTVEGIDADEVVCLATPERFFAVGQWYTDFAQTSDDEVVDLIERRRAATRGRWGLPPER